jgi:hypothetical protein
MRDASRAAVRAVALAKAPQREDRALKLPRLDDGHRPQRGSRRRPGFSAAGPTSMRLMGRSHTGSRCAALRRDGQPCYATATWGRSFCPRHDPTVRFRPPGHPPELREQALELYRQVGPGDAARRLGLRPGTVRAWAHRAGEPPRWDRRTRAATEAARLAAELRRHERVLAVLEGGRSWPKSRAARLF